MIVGIVGAEALKFTEAGRKRAMGIIRELLIDHRVTGMCSGHCHLGGIDIWAEEIAEELRITKHIFEPLHLTWQFYKIRNLKIADKSDVVHSIAVDMLPVGFNGMRHALCYHCGREDHVKSGGCWTMKQAMAQGKTGKLHIVANYPV